MMYLWAGLRPPKRLYASSASGAASLLPPAGSNLTSDSSALQTALRDY